jgi:ABC-type sugar transport system permease subunit
MINNKKYNIEGYMILLPTLIVFALLIFYPAVRAFFESFTNASIFIEEEKYVGLENYINFLHDPDFWSAFGRTLILVASAVILQYILGIIMALLLNENLKGLKWVKYIVLIPWVIPVASTVVMFDWMVQPDYGLINMILEKFGLSNLTRYWFGDKNFAFPLIIMMHVWRNMPFYAITLYAGLKSIPKYLYDAAEIDGATGWQKFVYITLPSLKYPSMIVIVLHVLWTFNNFDFIYLSTGGGPVGRTEVLSVLTYETAWTYYEFGRASALGVLMLIVMMIFTIFYINIVRSDSDE